MTGWERFLLHAQLAILRGRENSLHSRIAGGYAQGRYHAADRREQQRVREEIKHLEGRLRG